jgi:hypothetical protein
LTARRPRQASRGLHTLEPWLTSSWAARQESRPALVASLFDQGAPPRVGGRGEGIDPPADAAARTALRQKALVWLRADLALWLKQAAAANAAGRTAAAAKLSVWLQDSDLAGVREPDPQAKLPDGERAEWEKLWADVKATLAAARKPTPPAGK